ncbi:MAG: hypothetical protein ACYDAC_10685 [Candidatus Dormibacteria bacterium]
MASAATCVCPTPVLPEAPGTPVLLVGAGMAAAALLSWLRRHRGLSSVIVSTLAVVVLAGVLFGAVAAGADTAACSCATPAPATPGGVEAITTTSPTPSTGAELPWVDALLLVGGGTLITLISVPRRRRRTSPADDQPV